MAAQLNWKYYTIVWMKAFIRACMMLHTDTVAHV